MNKDNTPAYKNEEEYYAGIEFFGISYDESCGLFAPSEYPMSGMKTTAKQVAVRVRRLIKKYTKEAV